MRSLEIPLGEGRLAGRLHVPRGEPFFAAVLAHGLQSSMQSEKLNRLARAMAMVGGAVLMFDHGGCGESPGDFQATTLTSRVREYLAAVRFLADENPGLPLVYLGSSMGGLSALVAASEKPPACLAVWSAPTDPAALFSGPEVAAGLPGMARDLAGHDLPRIIAGLDKVLFVHGEKDEVVPVEQARRGFELAREPKDLLIVAGADHRLSRLADQDLAIERTLAWLKAQIPA